MLYRVAFLFTIGLIASCAGERRQAAVDAVPVLAAAAVDIDNAQAAINSAAVDAQGVEAASDGVVAAQEAVNAASDALVAATAAAENGPEKSCGSAENKNTQVSSSRETAFSCRGEQGNGKCVDICGSLGFKLASCKTTSYRPRAANSSCVCSNDGKLGLVAIEYEGPLSLRRTPGYYKSFSPLKAPCNDCACMKVCESYRMSPDDTAFVPYTKGSCVDRTCICLKVFHAEKEEKLAKKKSQKRPAKKMFKKA